MYNFYVYELYIINYLIVNFDIFIKSYIQILITEYLFMEEMMKSYYYYNNSSYLFESVVNKWPLISLY